MQALLSDLPQKENRPLVWAAAGFEIQGMMPLRMGYAAFFSVFFLVAWMKMASIAMAKTIPTGYASAVL